MEEKLLKCSCCKKQLPEESFVKNNTKRGRHYICTECRIETGLLAQPKFKDGKKKCSCCKEYKDYSEFAYCKSCKNNVRYVCKKCDNERYNRNIDQIKAKSKVYRDKNKEHLNNQKREYYKNNKEKRKEYIRNRKINDPLYAISDSIRKNILLKFKRCLRGAYEKNKSTSDILGCTMIEFKDYIESKFEPWMNWDNRGLYNGELNYGWDLDHIVPMVTAKTEEDIYRLNHYTNFQPLCSRVNRDVKWSNHNKDE